MKTTDKQTDEELCLLACVRKEQDQWKKKKKTAHRPTQKVLYVF